MELKKKKKKATEWVFASHAYKGQYPEYIMKISTIQQQKYNVIKCWAKVLNGHFSKEDIKTANKHMKGCETPQLWSDMGLLG